MSKAAEDVSSEMEKRMIVYLYKNILYEITHFVLIERFAVSDKMEKYKLDVDPLNNFFIRTGNSTLKLIDIFTSINSGLETNDPIVKIDNIYKVNFFKKPIIIIIKRLIYGFISKRCRIYKDKANLWPGSLQNDEILKFLSDNYPNLGKLMIVLSDQLDTKIIYKCRQ